MLEHFRQVEAKSAEAEFQARREIGVVATGGKLLHRSGGSGFVLGDPTLKSGFRVFGHGESNATRILAGV